MLGTTLWLVVAIGLFATVVLDAASAFGRAGSHAAADHAIETAMHDAVADYQNRLQAAIAQSSPPDGTTDRYANAVAALPNPLERTYPAETASLATRFTLAYDVYPTTIAAPSCPQTSTGGAASGASGSTTSNGTPDAIGWLQCNAFVAESRMSLRVVVRILDPSGNATLAQREQYVTLRLFGDPPYSAVAGRKDASAADPATSDALAAPAHEGDLAGDTLSGASPAPLSGASPAPPAGPWPAGGTLIHVRYECHDGAGSCANAAPPDPDAGLRAGARWSNGNHPAP
ncbi:MAG TPA: hypothetical protein VK665_09945 [Candidatus Elarobacter sp.]|nr:hypothetical protein [Candidatus Elarobacter sp.]